MLQISVALFLAITFLFYVVAPTVGSTFFVKGVQQLGVLYQPANSLLVYDHGRMESYFDK